MAKLAIELDGSQHHETAHQAKNHERGAALTGLGLQVLRFNHRQVRRELDAMLEVIGDMVRGGHEERQIPSIPLLQRGKTSEVLPNKSATSAQGFLRRLIKPTTPQTNGMSERCNERIAEVLTTARFNSSLSLAKTLNRDIQVYNQHMPQQAPGHISPIQAMNKWYQKHPKPCRKRGDNLTELDSQPFPLSGAP